MSVMDHSFFTSDRTTGLVGISSPVKHNHYISIYIFFAIFDQIYSHVYILHCHLIQKS